MDFNILLMSHGYFAKEMKNSAEMIIGEIKNINTVSLEPGMSLEIFIEKAKEIMEKNENPTLIIVDLFGGTPANVATILSKQEKVRVISGLNLAMLIESVMLREYGTETSFDEIVDKLIVVGQDACKKIVL